jgi:polyvinyl alcohol dehydrogenase (cytochrome)
LLHIRVGYCVASIPHIVPLGGTRAYEQDSHLFRCTVSSVALTILLAAVLSAPLMAQDWPMFGNDLTNSANTQSTSLTTGNVGRLAPKWIFTTGGDVSARASVVGGVVYFPDWQGNLYALNANTGQVVWSHQLSDYGVAAGTVSRTAPTIVDGVLFIGTQYVASGPTGWLMAIDARTGRLIWKTQPDTSNSFPVITTSPVVALGIVYVGMTSNEEFAAANPYYPCCSARGSVVAVNAFNGAKLWQTFTVPTGYTGGAVWGSNPVVDLLRGTVYIGTGDNYSHPTDPAFLACIAAGGVEANCLPASDHVDSILAIDMWSGRIKWAQKMVTWTQAGVASGSDDWNVACAFGGPNCPANLANQPTGPDFDFGSAPNEITYNGQHGWKTIIGAGQKSGIYYAFDPDTGALLWQTQVGPGSSLGGMEWGSASDGNSIYVAISNLYGIPYSGGNAGSWAALDPATGAIKWQVPDPNGAVDLGPLAVAKGVVYTESMAGTAGAPTMFALDASSGHTLWSYPAGSSVIAGATISGDSVYWGSGYAHLGIPGYTGNNKFYAFSRNGN